MSPVNPTGTTPPQTYSASMTPPPGDGSPSDGGSAGYTETPPANTSSNISPRKYTEELNQQPQQYPATDGGNQSNRTPVDPPGAANIHNQQPGSGGGSLGSPVNISKGSTTFYIS